ncbi:glycosyltransferase family 2 protein [Verticiella sediminum]|uniref:Glycosyltransferase family 2 protein n=1 Tax=Verticiella sediminum TaxID=1247510 RepID=A0A556APL7_9BURK|nr:glycosyltransferase family A protein [Verticiella sediminum]TSH94829.1 glycosyltransferase family 2 protein [Verticiella sediminum]
MIGVCIPVHNEQAHLAACLQSVMAAARHPGLVAESVHIVLVLDYCRDASARIAREWPVQALAIHARNVGVARAVGAARLLALGARWLACTDADSRVAPDWLVCQLALRAPVVCGTIAVADWTPLGASAAAARAAFTARYQDRDGHRHVHGANLGMATAAYHQVGGFAPLRCSEDQHLVDRMAAAGIPIAWSARPRVYTSARPHSRVRGGFADTLRRSAGLALERSVR